jgi:hypothetical protein
LGSWYGGRLRTPSPRSHEGSWQRAARSLTILRPLEHHALWRVALPAHILVMPRLRTAVNGGTVEGCGTHSHVAAWLPYLQVRLVELYPVIRAKLAMALQVRAASSPFCLVLLPGVAASICIRSS